jgi:hypothetical protein
VKHTPAAPLTHQERVLVLPSNLYALVPIHSILSYPLSPHLHTWSSPPSLPPCSTTLGAFAGSPTQLCPTLWAATHQSPASPTSSSSTVAPLFRSWWPSLPRDPPRRPPMRWWAGGEQTLPYSSQRRERRRGEPSPAALVLDLLSPGRRQWPRSRWRRSQSLNPAAFEV